MKLYENIVIGNFLFALGFAIRARQATNVVYSSVNLLQQTPADKLLGDVLLKFPGVVRLIEFKAEDNRSSKELARHRTISTAIEGTRLKKISRSVHWYIETAADEKSLVSRIVPYLDAFPKEQKNHRLENFIESLAQEVVNPTSSFTPAEIKAYLDWVREAHGGGNVGTGGLLLTASHDGTLHYAPMADLSELDLRHEQWIEFSHQRHEREMVYQHKLEREREMKLERKSRSIGMER